jgi:hypothetical protein
MNETTAIEPSASHRALKSLREATEACDKATESVLGTAQELVKLRDAINGLSPEDLVDSKANEITTRIPARAVLSYKEMELVSKQNTLAEAVTSIWAALAELSTAVQFEPTPAENAATDAVSEALKKFSLPERKARDAE